MSSYFRFSLNLTCPQPPLLPALGNTNLLFMWEFHIKKNHTIYIAFCAWLLYGQIIFHCMDIPHITYPLISRWIFALFLFLSIMNNAAVNTHVPIFARAYVFISLGYTPSCGIIGSYGDSSFKLLRNCWTILQSRCPTSIILEKVSLDL